MHKQRIEEYFASRQAEMLEDISRLVRIRSDRQPARPGEPYGPGAAAVLAEALAMARAMGFVVKNYDNRVGTVDLNDLPPALDILAHLDVVPGGDGWTVTKPFEPRITAGRIYGRGTADDKGPAVAALYALRGVRDLGIPLRKNTRLILGTDEESGSSDIEYYYAQEKEAPMTFTPDAEFPVINIEKGRLVGQMTAPWPEESRRSRLISLEGGTKINMVPEKARAVVADLESEHVAELLIQAEKSTGVIFTAYPEGKNLVIHAQGKAAHAATAASGNNAITGLLFLLSLLPIAEDGRLDLLRQLYHLFPHGDHYGQALGIAMSDDLSGPLTLSLDLIRINDHGLEAEFDCRTPLCGNDENVRQAAANRLRPVGIRLADHPMVPPHHVPAETPFVRTLLRCYEIYSGKPGRCMAIGGGTYVHNLDRGVAFGCADPEVDNHLHGPDEFAVIEQLMMSARIFTQVIIDCCG
ncbi:MAG: M20 family metallopeptidase [Clostridiaceae bacterium]|nr:M20 family metallopeptidase [Clostridiaceae bacterium]